MQKELQEKNVNKLMNLLHGNNTDEKKKKLQFQKSFFLTTITISHVI